MGRLALLLTPFFGLFIFFSHPGVAQAATFTSSATGNWDVGTTWGGVCVSSCVAGTDFPGGSDTAIIASNHIVTVNADSAASVLTINANAGAGGNGVTLSSGKTLAVSGAITLNIPTAATTDLVVDGGILTAGSIAIPGSATANRFATVSVSTGTVTVSGSVTFSGSAPRARYISTSTSTTNIGGNFGSGGTLTTTGTGTFNFNGSGAQTIGAYATYNNVQINNSSGGVTFTGTTTFGGTLLVNTGTLDIAGFNTTVTGATTINSILQFSTSTTGTKTFGDITIASGGKLDFVIAETLTEVGNLTIASGGTMAFSTAGPVSLNGNLAVNGTGAITGTTGTWSFLKTGGGGTISGSASSIAINAGTFTTSYTLSIPATIPTVTVTGTTLTNTTILTANTALSGTGQLTQSISSVLNLGGTSGIATLDASASTNEVHYTSTTGAQTLKSATYHDLFIEKSGQTGTLGGVITVNNNLTITAGNLSDAGFQITGNATGIFTVPAGSTLTLGLNVAPTSFPTAFTNAHISLAATSTVNYNATAAQTISHVPTYGNLIMTGGSVTKTASGAITVNGNFTNTTATAVLADGGFTITIKGNSTMTGTHTGTGKIVLSGGSGTHSVAGTGSYNNVELDDTNGVTQTGVVNIGGTLTITTGTWSANNTIAVTGATSVASTLDIAATTGTKTFGDLTINTGASMTFTAPNEPIVMNGNLAVNGTGAITGTTALWTFSKVGGGTIGGTSSNTLALTSTTFTTSYSLGLISTFPTVTVTSPAVLTNNSTLTVNTSFTGSGQLTQASGSVLNLGSATNTITTLDASASTNEVHYTRTAGPQTIKSATYHHLFIDEAGQTGTLGGAITVNGNLIITAGNLSDGGSQITGNASGTLTIPANSTLTLGTSASTTSFPTAFTNAHISLATASTVNYNSNSAQTISHIPTYGNLTTNATGAVTKTASGAITVNGTFTNGTNNTFADGGFTITLKDGATMTGTHTGTGKILFTGGSVAHSVAGAGSYNNVELDDTNGVTQTAATNIGGTLTITSGTWSPAGTTLAVTGDTSISGTLSISSTAGTKTLGGNVTINNSGSISLGATETLTISGNLTINNGGTMNFSAAGIIPLSGNLAVNGTGAITGTTGLWTFSKVGGGTIGGTAPSITISGNTTFATQYTLPSTFTVNTMTVSTGVVETNAGTTTINTSLAGAGTFSQGTSTVLNLGGTSGITTLNASASPNDVHYTSTTAGQTVHASTYYNLFLDKPGQTGSMNGITNILGNFVSTAGTTNFLGSTVTITGTTDIHGILLDQNNAGLVTFGGLLTMHPTSSWSGTAGEACNFTFHNGMRYDGGAFVPGDGTFTFDTNSQSITGSSAISVGNLDVSGIQLTNSSTGALSISTGLSGTGEFIQNVNTILTIGGTATITTLTATASGNSVNYNGTSAQTIKAATYRTLDVSGNTNGNVNITADTTASTTLILGATKLSTGSNNLIIAPGASLLRSSGFIIGNLEKNAPTGPTGLTFEVGTGGDYTPVDITFGTVTVAGDLVATATASDHASIGTSHLLTDRTANRSYTLTNSGASFDTYGATLTFVPTDVDTGATTANFIVAKFDSGTWSRPTIDTITPTSVSVTGLTSMSDFQIGEPEAEIPLPAPVIAAGSSFVGVVPAIAISKVASPLQLSTGPGLVTYRYTVRNFGGQLALTDITVTDDKCSPLLLLSGDVNGNRKLDTTETWIYNCATTLLGTTTSMSIVTGYSDTSNHQPVTASVIGTVVVGSPSPASPPSISPNLPNTGALSSAPSGGGLVVVNRSILNIRKSAALSGPIIGQAAAKAQGTIIGDPVQKDGYTWVQVQYQNGLTGWSVAAGLTRTNSPAPKSVSPGFKIGNQVRTTREMNVRSGAGVFEVILGSQIKGNVGIIVRGPIKKDGYIWWQVKYGENVTGWTVESGLVKVP